MRPDKVRQALTTIQDRLHGILDESAKGVLADASAQLRVVKPKNKKKSPPWQLTISRDQPLRFKTSLIDGLRVQVDVSCAISWDDGLQSQDVLVRLWSHDDKICFREQLDSATVRQRLAMPPKRVITRYHFDKANPGQDGPAFHLQYGGNATDAEIFWHPESFSWPRIIHHPMDLVLACELVASNFFVSEYRKIAKDPSWVAAVRESQCFFLKDYYISCVRFLSNEKSLMTALWNRN